MAKFVISKDSKKEFRWAFKADNGQIVAVSGEGYTTKQNCELGIAIVKKQSPNAAIEDQT